MPNKKPIILLMGPQGSGKTTQGKLLAEQLGYLFISSGELIRESILKNKNRDEYEHMKKGDFITDSFVEGLLFPILDDSSARGFVLDGYPRSLNQIDHLLRYIGQSSHFLQKVLYIHISEKETKKRIAERKKLENRPDEDVDALEHRLKLYHVNTEPLLLKYESMGILTKIDGEQAVESINKEILSKIE